MNEEETMGMFHLAANNAVLYGVGLIKMINTPTGIVVEVVAPQEYLRTSESLKWLSENIELPRTQ